MSDESDWALYEEQQDKAEAWVDELATRLGLDKAATWKVLVDCVYINTDTDWLKMAVTNEEQGFNELATFLVAARAVWEKHYGKTTTPSASDEVLERIEQLIDDYREAEYDEYQSGDAQSRAAMKRKARVR